ncbi:MAG: hypothetical protein RIQ60_3453 [Pseudomonadota bacterium]|jgi:maltooligosyltrehalose trehalohydrolase
MADIGHYHRPPAQGGIAARSHFRLWAPKAQGVQVLILAADGKTVAHTLTLQRQDATGGVDCWTGYWTAECEALPHGTLYWVELDGRRLPDPASRYQPQGVHGPSMVVELEPVASPGWRGITMADAILYELHLGTFTPEGTLAGAQARLDHLQALGVNAIELLPIAAFPGERNWGYDGTCLFALHQAYGSYADLKAFIEAAHQRGMAVILDVVYNHFGPEGNYSGAYGPYTKAAATPWGAAINFDIAGNHGVREYFLENLRWWLQTVGFDGVRMDAVSLIFDNSPVHILREFTDLAREIGRQQGREVLTIAEHLRNNRYVTSEQGFGYHSQWNDDLNHAIYARLSGETWRHYQNFGSLADVAKALTSGFVYDGSRYDRYYGWFVGTDGRLTTAPEHVVHIQNHDQIGNRLHGDRMIATHGRAKALLAITAVMASPFVPMLWMGEEYGETAPFYFFEDFGDQHLIDGCRDGRKSDFAFDGAEPPDPHARQTFVDSRLQWQRLDEPAGREVLAYYRQLIALKRSSALGPRDMQAVSVELDDATEVITVRCAGSVTVLNFSSQAQAFAVPPGYGEALLCSVGVYQPGQVPAFGAIVLRAS